MNSLRIIFAGTPEFGLPCLSAISQSNHQLLAIYTQPDRPVGRGQVVQNTPVKQWALEHNLPVYQPENFKSAESIAQLAALKPDVLVVIAYGLLLPQTVLDIPTYGCINVHASLLPRWRGASPLQQAILHGDHETGVTIMQMEKGLDTGPYCAQISTPIEAQETTATLHTKLTQLAVHPLLSALEQISNQQIIFTPQISAQVTYAPKIKKEDAHIDWNQSADVIDRQIRAFNPWPIARCTAHGEVIRIHQAHVLRGENAKHTMAGSILQIDKQGMQVATGQGILCITRIQFAGGKVIAVSDWFNGGRAQAYLGMLLT